MSNDIVHSLVESQMGLRPTGDIQWMIGLISSMDDYKAGKIQRLFLGLTPMQALEVAEELHQLAEMALQKTAPPEEGQG